VRDVALRCRMMLRQVLLYVHDSRSGKWPQNDSGPVVDASHEKWMNIDQTLRKVFADFPANGRCRNYSPNVVDTETASGIRSAVARSANALWPIHC
jgi:hypothetical protein